MPVPASDEGLIKNTGILQYTFTYVRDGDGVGGGWRLEGVTCDVVRGCVAHLEKQDGRDQTNCTFGLC